MDSNPFPLAALHEINGRCLDLLAHAARTGAFAPFSLVAEIREALLASTPESRRRAAHRNFLLVDLEFRNPEWWQAVSRFPEQPFRGKTIHCPFARRSAIRLTRATLMAAWQAIHSDSDASCILLAMDRDVANVIAHVPITTLDRIADRRHRHLQPRWPDRPEIWRGLLQAAEHEDRRKSHVVDVHGLQLLSSDLLTEMSRGPKSSYNRLQPTPGAQAHPSKK